LTCHVVKPSANLGRGGPSTIKSARWRRGLGDQGTCSGGNVSGAKSNPRCKMTRPPFRIVSICTEHNRKLLISSHYFLFASSSIFTFASLASRITLSRRRRRTPWCARTCRMTSASLGVPGNGGRSMTVPNSDSGTPFATCSFLYSTLQTRRVSSQRMKRELQLTSRSYRSPDYPRSS